MDIEKERIAIERLKAFEPETEPYYLCYSGGKDSDVIRILAHLAGVKHEIHHNLTSVDVPETIRYVKSVPNVIIDIPHDRNGNRISMWSLIVKKGIPPTRIMRYCCSELKETGGKGRMKITGVRSAESLNRAKKAGMIKIIGKPKTVQKMAENIGADYEITQAGGLVMNMDNDENRRLVEHCYRTTSTMINPILDWTDADVWEFLQHYGCESNPLYQCGKRRIGCIGCPLQGFKGMKKDFIQYPKYKYLYIMAFERMLESHQKKEYSWKTGLDVFDWWTDSDRNQMTFDMFDT
ncbi:MAG: phosphoadenosine phosphosulfate reductase family protein [Ruminococcus sp.]|nr:phosphoadenosine phosphosulfate reductase family protein [Ruminococcus sp.]MDE7226293.1 phosphoadenosine phosphosulfate reductase family protein [Ruminococcus sp.]